MKCCSGNLVTGKPDEHLFNLDHTYEYTVYGPSVRNLRSYNYNKVPTCEEDLLSYTSLYPNILDNCLSQDRFYYAGSKIKKKSTTNDNNKIILYVPDDEHGGYGYKPHIHHYADTYMSSVTKGRQYNKDRPTHSDDYLCNHLGL